MVGPRTVEGANTRVDAVFAESQTGSDEVKKKKGGPGSGQQQEYKTVLVVAVL
jgi:hypothetical protein